MGLFSKFRRTYTPSEDEIELYVQDTIHALVHLNEDVQKSDNMTATFIHGRDQWKMTLKKTGEFNNGDGTKGNAKKKVGAK